MFSGILKKTPLYLASALFVISPFVFLPIIDEKEAFRLPKEAFSLFMISVICGIRGVLFLEERFGREEQIFTKKSLAASLKRDRLTLTLLLFCLYLFASSHLSSRPFISLRVSFNVFLFTLLFLFVVSNVLTTRQRRLITNSLVVPGVVMALYSFFQYFGHDPIFVAQESYMKRFLLTSGFIDNPNLFAGYLVALLPVSLAGAIGEKTKGRNVFSTLCFMIMLTALILTNARTGLIALLAALLFFIFLSNRWGVKKYLAIGGALFVLLSGSYMMINKVYMAESRKGMELPDKSFDVRLIHWKSAWLMVSESPRSFLFGKGAGTFKIHYLDYRIQAVEGMKTSVRFENSHHAHNEYIQLWAESGVLAIILLVITLIFFIKTVYSFYEGGKVPREKHLIVSGYLASFVAVLVNGLASFPFHIVPSALAAVTAAALSIATLKGNDTV